MDPIYGIFGLQYSDSVMTGSIGSGVGDGDTLHCVVRPADMPPPTGVQGRDPSAIQIPTHSAAGNHAASAPAGSPPNAPNPAADGMAALLGGLPPGVGNVSCGGVLGQVLLSLAPTAVQNNSPCLSVLLCSSSKDSCPQGSGAQSRSMGCSRCPSTWPSQGHPQALLPLVRVGHESGVHVIFDRRLKPF